MIKFFKIMGKILYKLIWIIFALTLLGVLGLLVWVDLNHGAPMLSMLWFAFLPCTLFGINWCIGLACGDKLADTGLVHDGDSVLDVVRTSKFYLRRIPTAIIEIFLFIALGVRFGFWLSVAKTIAIVGIVGSVVAVIVTILWIFFLREKYRDMKSKNL